MLLQRSKFVAFGVIAILFFGVNGALAEKITLNALDGTVSVSGDLLDYDGVTYHLKTPVGEISIAADQVSCIGADCPNLVAGKVEFSIVGSATIGENLLPSLIEVYALERGGDLEVSTAADGTTTYSVLEAGGAIHAEITVLPQDSLGGFAALVEGSTDIGMSSRRASNAEAAGFELAGQGKLREASQERIIALDGVILAVNRANPVQALDMEQSAGIFEGRITNWKQVGGNDAPIVVYRQADTSGTATVLSMRAGGVQYSGPAIVLETESDVSDAVTADQNGIGLTSFSQERNARALDIRSVCGAVFEPSLFSIKTEEYPLTRRMYFYTTSKPLPDVAAEFIEFVQSDGAQSVINNAGYTGQNSGRASLENQGRRMAQAIVSAGGRTELLQLQDLTTIILDAERLSFTLRYNESGALDARALRDIERVAAMIRNKEFTSRQLLILGFSHNQNSANEQLSSTQSIAQNVRDAIVTATGRANLGNVRLSPIGYGSLLPLSCNESEDGRASNNRVEIWVK